MTLDTLADLIIEATGCDPRTDEPELFDLAVGECVDCHAHTATAILDPCGTWIDGECDMTGECNPRRLCAHCGCVQW